MRSRMLLSFAFLIAAGCGGERIVPVSGKVTLDGQPLAKATVSFQPVAKPGSLNAGPASSAKTDTQGHYKLKGIAGQDGALVGEHRVMISLQMNDPNGDDRRRGGPPQIDKVPARYNKDTELKFQVTAATDKADFELLSK
jgi:hypothetical protein